MVGQGLLTREGDLYANSAAAATYLAGDGDALDLRPFLAFWDGISYNHWTDYADTVRRDAPAAARRLHQRRARPGADRAVLRRRQHLQHGARADVGRDL